MAQTICEAIEKSDVRCWIAPRNIPPGSVWAKAIVKAIRGCEVMVVLLSEGSAASEYVHSEVQEALDRRKRIVPIFLDDAPLPDELPLPLKKRQGLKISSGAVHAHLDQIVAAVRKQVFDPNSSSVEVTQPGTTSAAAERPANVVAQPMLNNEPSSVQHQSPTGRGLEHQGDAKPTTKSSQEPSDKARALVDKIPLAVVLAGSVVIAAVFATRQLWTVSSPANASQSSEYPKATPEPAPGTIEALPQDSPETLTNSIGMKLVRIPAGAFRMGSLASEPLREAGEDRFECTISKPFYLSTTEVTRAQFQAFVRAVAYKTDAEQRGFSSRWGITRWDKLLGVNWKSEGPHDPADWGQLPVVHVTWNDAKQFCQWLSKSDGKTYDLPTEAQWEYAFRNGSDAAWPWGDSPALGEGLGNALDISAKQQDDGVTYFFPFDDGYYMVAPVASFRTDGRGIYDMLGNVREWCRDWQWQYPSSPATDPFGATPAEYRMVRGSSYCNSPAASRSANRCPTPKDISSEHIGFRVLMEVTE